jgi:hypothetical protein
MCLTVGVWMIHAVHMFGWNGINSFFHESFEVLFLNFAVKRYGVVTLLYYRQKQSCCRLTPSISRTPSWRSIYRGHETVNLSGSATLQSGR